MTLPEHADVAVIGAGPAGCAAALALRRRGHSVALIDREPENTVRFCGEFLSGESLAVLSSLGVGAQIDELGGVTIRRLALHGARGGRLGMELLGGGRGLGRSALDSTLFRCVRERGAATASATTVESLTGSPADGFEIDMRERGSDQSSRLRCRAVVGAWGRHSPLDAVLERPFLARKSNWIGVKVQYDDATLSDLVSLYLFRGGHCGFVSVENGGGTLAVLALRHALQEAGGRPLALVESIVRQNGALAERIGQARPRPGKLRAISRIPFLGKGPLAADVFLAGDSAGLTAPFLGLGATNALFGGAAAAEAVADWLEGGQSFEQAARSYASWWRGRLGRIQRWSWAASRLLCEPLIGEPAVRTLGVFPALGRSIYRRSRASLTAIA